MKAVRRAVIGVLFAPFVLSAAVTAASDTAPRSFDVVAPPGTAVEVVDGQAIVRIDGPVFGTVASFEPESAVRGRVRLAIVNRGTRPLSVGTAPVLARYGDSPLKVWSTTGLIREAKRRRAAAYVGDAGDAARDAHAIAPPSTPRLPSPSARSEAPPPSQRTPHLAVPPIDDADARRARLQAVPSVAAVRSRLFRERRLAPGEVAVGDVTIDLPPRRDDGVPAAFVITLPFGGARLDLHFRERGTPVDGDASTTEPTPD